MKRVSYAREEIATIIKLTRKPIMEVNVISLRYFKEHLRRELSINQLKLPNFIYSYRCALPNLEMQIAKEFIEQ